MREGPNMIVGADSCFARGWPSLVRGLEHVPAITYLLKLLKVKHSWAHCDAYKIKTRAHQEMIYPNVT